MMSAWSAGRRALLAVGNIGVPATSSYASAASLPEPPIISRHKGLPLAESHPFARFRRLQDGHRCHRRRYQHHQHQDSSRTSNPRPDLLMAGAFTGIGLWTIFKHMTGIETLDGNKNDPFHHHLEAIRKLRKAKKFEEAEAEVHAALELARAAPDAAVVETKLYDELAQVMLESNELEKAEEIWKMVLSRILQVHNRHDGDPDFIVTSIKLAEVMAKRGKSVSAETGYRHCITKQEAIAAEMKERLEKTGVIQHPVDAQEEYGRDYSDPLSLLGLCLESFAHFLVSTEPQPNAPKMVTMMLPNEKGALKEVDLTAAEAREEEANRAIFRAVELSTILWGQVHSHTIVILNSFGLKCLSCGKFATAAKALEEATRRAVLSGTELSHQLPAYYCNFAEALFHSGQHDKALDVARRALILAESPSFPKQYGDIKMHCRRFVAAIEQDYKKTKKDGKWFGWW